jgi:hypothetical protein
MNAAPTMSERLIPLSEADQRRRGQDGPRHKVVLYNPRAVFYTMPLGLLAVGSYLDPAHYEVVIIDGRLEQDPIKAVLEHLAEARWRLRQDFYALPVEKAVSQWLRPAQRLS